MSATPVAPRIGVFICHCGSNIGGVVDCPAVAGYASGLKDVISAKANMYTCSTVGQEEIRKQIKSIQNTQKITRAMEMVAASKMRKAQEPPDGQGAADPANPFLRVHQTTQGNPFRR